MNCFPHYLQEYKGQTFFPSTRFRLFAVRFDSVSCSPRACPPHPPIANYSYLFDGGGDLHHSHDTGWSLD